MFEVAQLLQRKSVKKFNFKSLFASSFSLVVKQIISVCKNAKNGQQKIDIDFIIGIDENLQQGP